MSIRAQVSDHEISFLMMMEPLSNPGLFQSLLHIISFLLANRSVKKQIQQINFATQKNYTVEPPLNGNPLF